MNLKLYLSTLKDRIKLRLALDEAADLRRDLALCQRGSDAWVTLRANIEAMDNAIRSIAERVVSSGWSRESPAANRSEVWGAALLALAAIVSALAVILEAA